MDLSVFHLEFSQGRSHVQRHDLASFCKIAHHFAASLPQTARKMQDYPTPSALSYTPFYTRNPLCLLVFSRTHAGCVAVFEKKICRTPNVAAFCTRAARMPPSLTWPEASGLRREAQQALRKVRRISRKARQNGLKVRHFSGIPRHFSAPPQNVSAKATPGACEKPS